MDTKEMLQAYAAENGVAMSFDADGACTLPLDEERVLHLQFRDAIGELDLLALLGPVPAELRGRIFEQLLAANYYWKDTLGATLSWHAELEQVVLTYPIKTATTDEATLRGSLDRFADLQAAWAERLKCMIVEAEAQQEMEADDDDYADYGTPDDESEIAPDREAEIRFEV